MKNVCISYCIYFFPYITKYINYSIRILSRCYIPNTSSSAIDTLVQREVGEKMEEKKNWMKKFKCSQRVKEIKIKKI